MNRFYSLVLFVIFVASPVSAKTVCPECGFFFAGTQTVCEYDGTPLQEWLEIVGISGGLFDMGSDDETLPEDERPKHSVLLGDFSISVTEVTIAQYTAFLNDRKPFADERRAWITLKGESADWGSGHDSHIYTKAGVYHFDEGWGDYPVTFVSWEGAHAFCERYFLRLPTEAEWEYAAVGPGQLEFPCGDKYELLEYCSLENPGPGEPPLRPVGSFQNNGYGLFDMSGNAAEWCYDFYGEEYYAVSSDKNPTGPARGIYRVTRGGSWGDGRSGLRCRARVGISPEVRDSRIGFRVAAD